MKTIQKTVLILVLVFAFVQGSAKFGYKFTTVGLFGGMNFYHSYYLYSSGINLDRFHKCCVNNRTYEGLQLELGLGQNQTANRFSFRVVKGFIRPFLWNRLTSIHPVVSCNFSFLSTSVATPYYIRPEIGFVVARNYFSSLATRIMAFYGYEFGLKTKDFSAGKPSQVFGFKIIMGIDLSKRKKETVSEPVN